MIAQFTHNANKKKKQTKYLIAAPVLLQTGGLVTTILRTWLIDQYYADDQYITEQ